MAEVIWINDNRASPSPWRGAWFNFKYELKGFAPNWSIGAMVFK